MRLALLAAWLLLAGCILEDVPLEGKSCPCADGFICDDAVKLCVRMLEPRDAGVDAGTGGPDAGRDAGGSDAAPIPECARDSECSATQICVGSACEADCDITGCQGTEICDSSGHCFSDQATCTLATDCNPPHQICSGGRCVPGCAVGTGSCSENRICDSSSGFCEAAPRCSATVGCPDRQFSCSDGTCLRRCDAPGAAPCIGDLALGTACTADDACATGFCHTAGDPPASFCSSPCGRTGDCPLGFTCAPTGSGYRVCAPERIFAGASFETPSGDACTNPDDVCQSESCDQTSMRCVEQCSRNLDCAAYGIGCVVEECGAGPGTRVARESCGANADCVSGICDKYRNVCADRCCTDSDCGADQNCLIYDFNSQTPLTICQATTSSNAGSTAIGAPCTTGPDCASGTCTPASPFDLSGAKICSVRCCTQADCGALTDGYCHPLPGLLPGTQATTCVVRD